MAKHNNKLTGCLSERDGRLFIDDVDTNALVAKYGSPIFVMSESQLRTNARRFSKAFKKYWPDGPVDILPANKANWTKAVWAVLSQEGMGTDVYSEGELLSALEVGIERAKISVNGGGKSNAMLRKCIEEEVRITVEDLDEPERINKIAEELGKIAKIRFRVKPNLPKLWRRTDFTVESVSIDLGIQVYKSGVPAQYLEELGRKVLKMKHVELVGLHFHAGRHHQSLWYWEILMKSYGKLVLHLCKAWGGYRPQELDIGGGFASKADPHSRLKPRTAAVETFFTYPLELLAYAFTAAGRYRILQFFLEKMMVSKPGKGTVNEIEDYARVAVTTFRDTLLKGGMNIKGIRLQTEPGRAFFGNTGIHLTRVKTFKQQTHPMRVNWVLTDTTYFFMSGGVYEFNMHDFRVANKMLAPNKHIADIVGHSCYADRIVPMVNIPDVEEGDVIAFLDMGAYQEVSASNFNALPRPAIVMVNGDKTDIIKSAETIEDVFSRDIIPPHLT